MPANNSNWPLLNDPAINKAMDKARHDHDPPQRAQAWGKIDDDDHRRRPPAIPWIWDNQANIGSADVAGVINLFNANWDLSYTSLTSKAGEEQPDQTRQRPRRPSRAAGPGSMTNQTCSATSSDASSGGSRCSSIVSAVVFVIFYVFPSADPAQLRAGREASPAQVDAIRHALGLDQPVYTQYWDYMKGIVLHFDFGYSYQSNAAVRSLIFDRLPATIWLVSGAAILWLAMGIPVGIISAVRRRSVLDRTTMVTSLAFISAPVFWLGLVALYLFADGRRRSSRSFPASAATCDRDDIQAKVGSMILPWFVLAAASAAIYARYLRSSMIDVMSEDYIRTARAKGLPERTVIMRHGVRSAITPIVTLLGLDIGMLLAGNAILTETVFNIPGVGRLVYTSIDRSDLPVIQGVTLFGAFFIIIFNLIVDIAYAYLDPRVRYQ